jgi:hypothetical protein
VNWLTIAIFVAFATFYINTAQWNTLAWVFIAFIWWANWLTENAARRTRDELESM